MAGVTDRDGVRHAGFGCRTTTTRRTVNRFRLTAAGSPNDSTALARIDELLGSAFSNSAISL